jgi:tetratricopeptide (TPR) repeat protein
VGGHLSLAPAGSALVEEAKAAVELSRGRPAEAATRARQICEQAVSEADEESEAVAQRALGLAARELGDVAAAERHLRTSVLTAARAKLGQREGEARMSLASVLALGGRTDEALAEADGAAPLLVGADAARLQVQRALILQRLGRQEDALEGYREALEGFASLGEPTDQARVWVNRSVLLAYRGELAGAEADLYRAQACYRQLGLEVAAAEVRHNLGFVAALRGDIPAALSEYDAAAEEFRRLGAIRPHSLLDRCQALLAVGLVCEARGLAQVAVGHLEAAGMETDLAEARLVLAQAALLGREHRQAASQAGLARQAFIGQGRAPWAALAGHVALRAAWAADELGPQGADEIRATAEELETSGWAAAAADARLVAARLALAQGRVGDAEEQLAHTSTARRSGPADLRARAWHAEALLRLTRGDRRAASAALRAGLAVLDQHRVTLGATELRAFAAGSAGELASLGLRLALDSGRAARVLAWAERWRAGSHRAPAARPPADPAMAGDLAALRLAAREAEDAVLDGQDPTPFLRRRAALEGSVRRRARHSSVASPSTLARPLDVRCLAERLGERVLVELVEGGRGLHAVTVAGGRVRLWHLGSVAEVAAEVSQLRFSLARLARDRGSVASREAAGAALVQGARRLDDLVLGPLAAELGERALVVVPTGVLHGMPWAVLPSCRGRPLAVAPSAAHWLLAEGRGPLRPPSRAVLVAGPGIGHGTEELAQLAALYPGATSLVGAQATVAAVSVALGQADLTHVAAHGTFRADNPLFSCLHLGDGPLTVYDLEELPSVPKHVVLSACDVGTSAVAPGDELLGLAAALLALGTRSVVASVLPVPDDATRTLMVELHRRLVTGTSPAVALAEAQADMVGPLSAIAPVAVSAFTCFGAG